MMPRRKIWCLAVVGALVLVLGALLYRVSLPDAVGELPKSEYPVRGIDISAHNGVVDFQAVRASGMEFVLVKATEGNGFKDSRFVDNVREARRAGLKVGAYHFFRFDASGVTQAINFMHSIRGRKLDLPAVVDLEEWTNPSSVPDDTVAARLDDMLRHLRCNGYDVLIYTNKDGYERFVKGRFSDYPLWLCSFSRIDESDDWVLWQYSHRGEVSGVDGHVDMNVFRGDSVAWNEMCLKWLGETQ